MLGAPVKLISLIKISKNSQIAALQRVHFGLIPFWFRWILVEIKGRRQCQLPLQNFWKYLVCKLQVERYDTVINLVVIRDVFGKSRLIFFSYLFIITQNKEENLNLMENTLIGLILKQLTYVTWFLFHC